MRELNNLDLECVSAGKQGRAKATLDRLDAASEAHRVASNDVSRLAGQVSRQADALAGEASEAIRNFNNFFKPPK